MLDPLIVRHLTARWRAKQRVYRAQWQISLEDYLAMWAPRFRERRTRRLRLLRIDSTAPWRQDNMHFIEGGKRSDAAAMWAAYRLRHGDRRKP